MNKPTVAVLLSAFVFPGAGHFFLKKYLTATALIGIASSALYILLSNAIVSAREIAGKIVSGEIAPDVAVIRDAISNQRSASDDSQIFIATTIFTIVWIIAIVDSYRIGRAQDSQ